MDFDAFFLQYCRFNRSEAPKHGSAGNEDVEHGPNLLQTLHSQRIRENNSVDVGKTKTSFSPS